MRSTQNPVKVNPSALPEEPTVSAPSAGGVTWRAILVASALLVILSVIAFYVSILWRTEAFTSSVPPIAQLDVLILLGALMSLPVFRRSGLTRQELLVVYSILLVAAPIVSVGILYWMLPKTIVFFYLARANPAWEAALLPNVPSWFSPTETAAVEGFFLGKATVPWSLWLVPLGAWLSFAFAVFLSAACLLSLVQRQWIRNERLSFPMAQVPLEVLADTGTAGRARLSAAPGLWLGAGISLLLSFLSSLSLRIPLLPRIPLGPIEIVAWQKVGPLAGLGAYELVLWPWLIALAYLIPKELSFSCWFFWLVRLGLTVAAISAGATPQRPEEWWDSSFPAPYYQGTGAVLAIGVWTLWAARKHLGRALRIAASRQSGFADADEPMTYRLALIGFVLSFAWLAWFFCAAGCRLSLGVILPALIIGYYVIWARLRAETGLGFLAFPIDLGTTMLGSLGSRAFRPQELIALTSARWAFSPGEGLSFDTTTANLIDVYKIADSAKLASPRLMAAVVAALALALLLGSYIVLQGTYHYGYFGTATGVANYFPSLQTRHDPGTIFQNISNPTSLDPGAIGAIFGGGAFAILLGVLRLRFHWWPFHPIGYLAANCWGWNWYVTPFVVGWACKVLVIRYGGLRLHRRAIPFAIGLIVGNMLNSFLWVIVTLITKGQV